HTHAGDLDDLAGHALEHGRVDAVIDIAQQRLAGKLDQDPLVARCTHLNCSLHAKKSPPERGLVKRQEAYFLSFSSSVLRPAWAITSATKSSCFFSMPAPTSRRA